MVTSSCKVLAVFPVDRSRTDTVGLVKKADNLVRSARAFGLSCDSLMLESGVPMFNAAGVPKVQHAKIFNHWALFWRFPNFLMQAEIDGYDILWIRKPLLTPIWIQVFRRAKALGIKVILDIPTYPYDRESPFLRKPFYILDSLLNAQVKNYVSRIVTLSSHSTIYGIKTIQVSNGFPKPSLVQHKPLPKLSFLGVGQWGYWHGLDRLFNSLAKFNTPYHVTLIGDGPEKNNYMKKAESLSLNVEWLPAMPPTELEPYFAKADLGIGTLAIHRKGVSRDQSLKHRLYASVGLPFICTKADDSFIDVEGVFQIDRNENIINCDKLLEWGNRMKFNRARISRRLVAHATGNTWIKSYTPFFEKMDLPAIGD